MKPRNLFHRILAGPASALAVLIMLAAPASATPPVTADLKLHLDASQLTGLSAGATVTTWNDMSGLGNHATAAGTPIYKTGELNGKPVIYSKGRTKYGRQNTAEDIPSDKAARLQSAPLFSMLPIRPLAVSKEFTRNPHFPALRSNPMALSGASSRKHLAVRW
jgi:hypothetical protein